MSSQYVRQSIHSKPQYSVKCYINIGKDKKRIAMEYVVVYILTFISLARIEAATLHTWRHKYVFKFVSDT
jgi:hypothetical protein